jgi:hypothetical protein
MLLTDLDQAAPSEVARLAGRPHNTEITMNQIDLIEDEDEPQDFGPCRT